jgi:uncharacterized integral membrane protein
MNAKLIFKTIFLIIILALLVLMGMHNRSPVEFMLPPILPKAVKLAAGLMYIAFFALGLLTGTILTAGVGKGGGASRPPKSDR